jgi:SNARE protein
MADIAFWSDSLSTAIVEGEEILNTIGKTRAGADRTNLIAECETKIKRCKNIEKSFRMEMRLIPAGKRGDYEGELSTYKASIEKLGNELKWAKTESGKSELFGGGMGKAGGDGGASVVQNPEEEGDDMLKKADGIQDKTEQSLQHTQQMVEGSKEVATATIEELHRQREQIKDITEEVMTIEDNLARADKLIRTFGRRMATDKFIQCFACVNILLLTAVVIYAVVSDKGLSSNDEATPSNPV